LDLATELTDANLKERLAKALGKNQFQHEKPDKFPDDAKYEYETTADFAKASYTCPNKLDGTKGPDPECYKTDKDDDSSEPTGAKVTDAAKVAGDFDAVTGKCYKTATTRAAQKRMVWCGAAVPTVNAKVELGLKSKLIDKHAYGWFLKISGTTVASTPGGDN
jgi:hypothetical protein